MSSIIKIPNDLLLIDKYFEYIDLSFKEFNELQSVISNEGFIEDTWEAIKNAVKWLIEKIGQFIEFIIDLVKRIFNFIASFIKKITGLENNGSQLPDDANIPKKIKIEADTSTVEKELSNIKLINESHNSSEALDAENTSNVAVKAVSKQSLKHEKLHDCVNIRFDWYAVQPEIRNRIFVNRHLNDGTITISSDGKIRYTEMDGIRKSVKDGLELVDIINRALTDTDGYYQISYDDAKKLIDDLNDVEQALRGDFRKVEELSQHSQDFLKKVSTFLQDITDDKTKYNEDTDFALWKEFVGYLTWCHFRIGTSADVKDNLDYNINDASRTNAITIFRSVITVIRDIQNYYAARAKIYATTLRFVVLVHKDIADDLSSQNKITDKDKYFNKRYPIPQNISSALHKAFDYIEASIDVRNYFSDNKRKIILTHNLLPVVMKAHNFIGQHTKFELKNVMLTNGVGYGDREHGDNMSAMASTTISISVRAFLNKAEGFKLFIHSVANDATSRINKRVMLETIANMSYAKAATMMFLHEAKHTYDNSNNKFLYNAQATIEPLIENWAGGYNDYGGQRVEFSADDAARVIMSSSIYKSLSNEITRWLMSLFRQMLNDLKEAGITTGININH